MAKRFSIHVVWARRSSSFAAMLAVMVGLGDVWALPVLLHSHGGSAALLVYLAAVFAIAYPLLIAEQMLGRCARLSPTGSLARVSRLFGGVSGWQLLSGLFLVITFLVIPIYLIIGSWVIEYLMAMLLGQMVAISPAEVREFFDHVATGNQDTVLLIFFSALLTFWVQISRVTDGFALTLRYLMYGIFVLVAALACYAYVSITDQTSLSYYFEFRPEQLDLSGLFAIVSLAVLTAGVGIGAHMAVSAYYWQRVSLPEQSFWALVVDQVISLALMATVLVLLQLGLRPLNGPAEMLFVDLPLAFGYLHNGQIIGFLFFALLFLLLWSSMLVLSEVWTARFVEWLSAPRSLAALLTLSLMMGAAVVINLRLHEQQWSAFDSYVAWAGDLFIPAAVLLLALFISQPRMNGIWRLELGRFFYDEWVSALRVLLAKIIPLIVTAWLSWEIYGWLG